MKFTLEDFVRESNRIERIDGVSPGDLAAHERLLALPTLQVTDIEDFVRMVAGASLRSHLGMNVRVGNHYPPRGGPEIIKSLGHILENARRGDTRAQCFAVHCQYEKIHPFMDGNGRSGRAIWLWMMGGIEKAPLGFLHHFYYQSLDSK